MPTYGFESLPTWTLICKHQKGHVPRPLVLSKNPGYLGFRLKVPQNPFRPPTSARWNRNEDDTAATGERYHESQKWKFGRWSLWLQTSHPFHCAKNCVLLATLDVLGSDASGSWEMKTSFKGSKGTWNNKWLRKISKWPARKFDCLNSYLFFQVHIKWHQFINPLMD